MVTYLVGTDGNAASQVICDHFEAEGVDEDDQLVVLNVLTSDDVDDIDEGEAALALFEERFGDRAHVETSQVSRGNSPAEELTDHADEIGADRIVVALRRHSRTERIIFGSVAHALLQQVRRPVTLVPLEEYQPPESTE
ncbi:MAG: universal stress protein [Haloglomus sp.]